MRPRYRPAELGRGALGALLGILVAGGLARVLPGGSDVLPYLVAPMGASAVLLFAVPASPLAQPWPLVGGNLISTAVGLGAAWLFDDALVAAGGGVGAAIGTMMLLNCLHPPGGACALVGATAAPALQDQGLELVWMPVAINTLALLAIAIAVNNLTGRRYPHRPAEPVRRPGAPEPLGVQASDVEQAIARLDQGLDITPGDVVALLRDAETHALDRRLGSLPVSRVMEREVATVLPFESIYRARTLIAQRGVKALPVVDEETPGRRHRVDPRPVHARHRGARGDRHDDDHRRGHDARGLTGRRAGVPDDRARLPPRADRRRGPAAGRHRDPHRADRGAQPSAARRRACA